MSPSTFLPDSASRVSERNNNNSAIDHSNSGSVKKSQKNNIKQDFSINYAKIFEGKRVFTIAYRLFPERPTLNIEYAASVFRKDSEKENYNRRQHVQTARGRLVVRPLYTTFDFSKEMVDNLFEKDVPKNKEERRAWSTTASGQRWKELRRSLDEQIGVFLRREISKHGVGSKERLRRSEIERRRSARTTEDRKVAEITSLLAAFSKNGVTDRQAIEKVINMGNGSNGNGSNNVGNRTNKSQKFRDVRDGHDSRASRDSRDAHDEIL